MKNKNKLWLILLILGVNLSFAFAQYSPSINTQYTDPSYSGYNQYNPSVYWSDYNTKSCYTQQDFFVQIIPGECTPSVVRSDLLEEQNVPVFCKIAFIQTNPLIDLSKIKSLRFKGDYPSGVSGISYFPSRVALKNTQSTSNILGNKTINNDLGYLVISLSRQSSEDKMPDFIEGYITAVIDYDVKGAFGISETSIYASEISDRDWEGDYEEYGFWNGKGYVRADSVGSNEATISIYEDFGSRQTSFTLKKGETSKDIYLSDFYCAAGFNVKLEDIGAPVDSALLKINDKKIWVAKGDRIIDDKCRVSDLKVYSGGGEISISCPIENGKFDLSLEPKAATLNINGDSNQYAIGSNLGSQIYLAYVNQDSNYVVLIKDELSKTKNEFEYIGVYEVIDSVVKSNSKILEEQIKSKVREQYKKKLSNVAPAMIDDKIDVKIIKEGEEGFNVILNKILFIEDKDWSIEKLNESDILALDYYEEGIKYYEELATLYPNEKMVNEDEKYAAAGLYEAAQLAKRFGMNKKAYDLYAKLEQEYPDSQIAKIGSSEKDLMMKYDTSNSRSSIVINNENYFIDLLEFKKSTKEEMNVVLLINGKEEKLGLNEVRILKQGDNSSNLMIKEIRSDYVNIVFDKSGISKTEKLSLNNTKNQIVFDGMNIKLLDINLNEQAKIKIIPKNFGPTAETGFLFRVEIEKRSIRLTPEQTQMMIDSLKKTIEAWSFLNNNLRNLIRMMKAACYATSTSLSIESYFSKLSGESIARGEIMTGSGGWNDICEELVNQKKYTSVEQCLLDKKTEIEKDVEIYKGEIKKTEDIINEIEKKVGKDYNKVEEEFKKKFDDFCKNAKGEIKISGDEKVSFEGDSGICSWKNLTHQQRKEIMTLYNVKNSGSSALNKVTDKKLSEVVGTARDFEKENSAISDSKENDKNLGIKTTNPAGESVSYGDIKIISSLDSGHIIYKNFKAGESAIRVFIPYKKTIGSNQFSASSDVAGKEVIIQVEKTGGKNEYSPKGKIYHLDGKEVSEEGKKSVMEYISFVGLNKIKQESKKAYENSMKNSGQLRVKYFEEAPYKGLPSEIPFDTENGWYVEFSYVLGGFGRPYDESGRAVNYYICNVGENGLIEFKKSADDICRYYNKETGASIDFPGLSKEESAKLVSNAEKAIIEAAKQYGKDRVSVNGKTFGSGKSFGGEEGRCTDFMSAEKCNLLFNVCDPVICPPSRCDLGGRYRVDNVIQTGIIGSLTLCLPNANEGIAIPICLTGVYAGIEGFLSILNSTVDCLEENLRTGRNVGICDEVKSVYLCEFFFKQASSFSGAISSNVIGGIYGNGSIVRGGGEYVDINSAFENTKSATDYFRNDYMASSSQAFSTQSLQNPGFQVCRSFLYSGFSNPESLFSANNLFQQAIEPDSPPQYHAWFSEDILTTATVPSTSHYKVYYHIFAGNGIIVGQQRQQGISYTVYLKDLAGYNTGSYVVASGYIAPGRSADEARDFTAPSGYKQLCIVVNGKEECGFSQVSTSYYMDSLSDAYIESQLETDIKTEQECIAGTPTTEAFHPNQVVATTEASEPVIYNRGIIRVCASENPGKQVDDNGEYDRTNSSYDRWKIVGYCGDSSIKCWLDTNSVKAAIKDKGIEEQILDKVNLGVLGEGYWTEEKSREAAEQGEEFIKGLVVSDKDSKSVIDSKIKTNVDNLKKLSELGINNNYRARALYLLGNIYRRIAENLKKTEKNIIIDRTEDLESASGKSGTDSGSSTSSGEDIKGVDIGEVISDKTSDLESAETEIQESDLKNNILIKVNYLENSKTQNYVYKYSGVRWISDDTEFAEKNLGYLKGIEEIINKTNMKCSVVIGSKTIKCDSYTTKEEVVEEVKKLLV